MDPPDAASIIQDEYEFIAELLHECLKLAEIELV